MKFIKSKHCATLKNEHLGELTGTVLKTYCPEFGDQQIKQKRSIEK